MSIYPVIGMPGVRATQRAKHRIVFRRVEYGDSSFPGGRVIDGLLARDVGNTPNTFALRAGLLMGKVTATGKYANSIIGPTTVAYADNDLTLTVSAATALEIVRRIGTAGTVNLVGPPAAAGVVASTAVAFTAVNTTTGVLTVPDLNLNKIAGAFVVPNDGSQTPLSLLPDGFGKLVVDAAGVGQDVPWDEFPVGGLIDSANIVNWPADTSLQAWIRTNLSTVSGGKFVFSDVY